MTKQKSAPAPVFNTERDIAAVQNPKKMSLIERNRASNGYYFKKLLGGGFLGIAKTILLFGLCFLILQPIFNQISISLMSSADLFDPTVIAIPRNPSLANYRVAIHLMGYWGTLLRSLGITLLVAVLQIIACTLTAYGFARFKFPFKRFWFVCVLLTIIVPPQTIMAPLFLNFRFFDVFGIFTLTTGEPLNLLDTLSGYLILVATGMGLRSGLYVFMLRQYFRNMPKELEEAAYVDGCSRLRTFVQIMLPDAKPMLASCFLFAFVWQWTDGFYSTLFLREQGVIAVQMVGLLDRFRQYYYGLVGVAPGPAVAQSMIATGMLLGVIPLIILYSFTQRAFVESIGQSGLKM